MSEVKLKEQLRLRSEVEPLRIKEEPEPRPIKEEEPEEVPFHIVIVKTEDDEDESSELHHRPTEENREETEASSSDTDHSEDYSHQQAPAKRSYAMIPPDSRPFSRSDQGPLSRSDQGPLSRSDQGPFSSVCFDCGKCFRSESALQRHMTVHTGEKPFRCPVCDKGFTQRSSVHSHMRIHTGERPYVCSVCDKGFCRRSNFVRHQSSAHPLCPVCEARFPDEVKLREHLETHVEGAELLLRRRGQRSISCAECGERFRRKDHFQKHLRSHEAEARCSLCGDVFKHNGDLQEHVKNVHPTCPRCRAAVTDEAALNEHLRTLHGVRRDRPFRCPVCEEGFGRSSVLADHLRRLHPKCPLCETRVSDDETLLKEHLRTHADTGSLDPRQATPALLDHRYTAHPTGATRADERSLNPRQVSAALLDHSYTGAPPGAPHSSISI